MKQDNFSKALVRGERDGSPIRNERLLFRRAMVYAANEETVKASNELMAAMEMDERVLSISDEEDAAKSLEEQDDYATADRLKNKGRATEELQKALQEIGLHLPLKSLKNESVKKKAEMLVKDCIEDGLIDNVEDVFLGEE